MNDNTTPTPEDSEQDYTLEPLSHEDLRDQGVLSDSEYIDSFHDKSGIFTPFTEFLNHPVMSNIVNDAKNATKDINEAYLRGHPDAVKSVNTFESQLYDKAYTDNEAGRRLRDESKSKPNKLTNSALWEIFVSGVNRGISEVMFNSDAAPETKDYLKSWYNFDSSGRHRFPVQETVDLINRPSKSNSEPISVFDMLNYLKGK